MEEATAGVLSGGKLPIEAVGDAVAAFDRVWSQFNFPERLLQNQPGWVVERGPNQIEKVGEMRVRRARSGAESRPERTARAVSSHGALKRENPRWCCWLGR